MLLSEHGEVKLTDFGIAKAHNKQEQSLGNLIKGKIAFMSPEQAHGHELDARSDLFSLGHDALRDDRAPRSVRRAAPTTRR